MDLTSYTDDQLEQLRLDVINEQERRANLAQIPTTVTQLATQYLGAGGNKTDLDNAIANASS